MFISSSPPWCINRRSQLYCTRFPIKWLREWRFDFLSPPPWCINRRSQLYCARFPIK